MPAPVGKSGVIGKGLMGMSVKADTKFPNASMALAQFFTNSRADRAVQAVGGLSVVEEGVRGSVLQRRIDADRGQRQRERRRGDLDVRGHRPDDPNKGEVNAVVLAAVEKALFGGVPAQQALSDAVAEANKLID